MDLSVRVADTDNPYARNVEQFFAQEFPGTKVGGREGVLEQVFSALLGSSQYRFGPMPSPESQVAIRTVLRKSIAEGRPIPILIPYGSRKSVLGEPLDLAEVSSLRQLSCLNGRVKQFFSPGISVRLRLEDAGGHYLFADQGQPSRDDTSAYCTTFSKLVHILGYDFVDVVPESSLFDEPTYARVADDIYPLLHEYITKTDVPGATAHDLYALLLLEGWKGTIPQEQRAYYYRRYQTTNPGITPDEARAKLARYFAGSWARLRCDGSGADKAWGDSFLRVTFVPPIPGMPESMTEKYVYYRTVPLKYATSHMPPWRSKGFLRLNGSVTPKIASWYAKQGVEYTKSSIVFGRRDENVEVRSDFVIES